MNYINPKYTDTKKLAKTFTKGKPFPYIVMDNFFDEKTLNRVRNALTREHYDLKESDLFTFLQSRDLNGAKDKAVKGFVDYLKSESFIQYIGGLTGTKLKKGKISVHSTVYTNTHYLLCHDDELDTRKIALMIYLTDMKPKDGGSLRLFSKNGMVKSVTPKFNRLALFKISDKSLHDVEEVYTDAIRLTLGWWYYDQ